jgi:hypothetical protein
MTTPRRRRGGQRPKGQAVVAHILALARGDAKSTRRIAEFARRAGIEISYVTVWKILNGTHAPQTPPAGEQRPEQPPSAIGEIAHRCLRGCGARTYMLSKICATCQADEPGPAAARKPRKSARSEAATVGQVLRAAGVKPSRLKRSLANLSESLDLQLAPGAQRRLARLKQKKLFAGGPVESERPSKRAAEPGFQRRSMDRRVRRSLLPDADRGSQGS